MDWGQSFQTTPSSTHVLRHLRPSSLDPDRGSSRPDILVTMGRGRACGRGRFLCSLPPRQTGGSPPGGVLRRRARSASATRRLWAHTAKPPAGRQVASGGTMHATRERDRAMHARGNGSDESSPLYPCPLYWSPPRALPASTYTCIHTYLCSGG
jgi:hypothetical protein